MPAKETIENMRHLRTPFALALLASLAGLACSSSDAAAPEGAAGAGGAAGDAGADAAVGSVPEGCDPLVPSYCGFPFPSNAHTVDDPSTATGKRVAFEKKGLPQYNHRFVDPAPWSDLDGFSGTGTIMTQMPGATIVGLPTQDTLDASIADDSPTLILDATTGERVAHFSELDMSMSFEESRSLLLRPVVRLKDATRYIVAIRKVQGADGKPIAPVAAFQALRDGTPFADAVLEARRPLYADIFSKLEGFGVAKGDLQIAWDFTTASLDVHTRWMLHMRDDALAAVGAEGPTYDIKKVTDNPNGHTRRRIEGVMHVPLYLDKADAGGALVFGTDGLPKRNGTGDFGFIVNVPNSAVTGTPGGILQNGHGLLGHMEEGQDGYLAELADAGDFVTIAVQWVGMAGTDEIAGVGEDFPQIANALTGDIGTFKDVVGRQHQGFVNALMAMRMMKGRFYKDAAVQFDGASAIDPTQCYYRGDSQGGIFGTTYMALSTDVTRGLLGEPGAPYQLLLNRSSDFGPFFTLARGVYRKAQDLQMVLGLAQMLWDRTDPGGYVEHITHDPLPGTPVHQVLIHTAIGDQQVSPLGAHYIARAARAKNIGPVNRHVWGLEETTAPFTGSAMVEFSFGLPEAPKTNVPPSVGNDPHDWVRKLPAAYGQAAKFFREGVVDQFCTGACQFPAE